jgi:predicted ArsR family transcriptional regulator
MSSKTTKKANVDKADNAQRVVEALTEKPGSTAAELAQATGLGRATISKLLATLERDGTATRTPGERDGRRRTPDGWSKTTTTDRLRPGQLDDLVMAYVRTLDDPAGPVSVARALGRSSGAVANCLARRAKAGDLKQVGDKPRRYTALV